MKHRKPLCLSVRMEPAAKQAGGKGELCSPPPQQQTRKRSGSGAHSLQLRTRRARGEGDVPWGQCPPGDERWPRRPSEVPPPEPQGTLTGGSGTLLRPTGREEEVCRQQKWGFFSSFK